MVLTPRPPKLPSVEEVKSKLPPRDREQLDVSRLRSILDNQHSKPNILTVAELNYFADLFKFHSDEIQQVEGSQPLVAPDLDVRVRKLTREYLRKVDMYKETHVVTPDGEVVLVMPPIFVQVETLAPTPENDSAVMSNRKFNRSDIPRFSIEALAKLSEALNKQQRSATRQKEIEKAKERAHKLLDMFYGRNVEGSFVEHEKMDEDHHVDDRPNPFDATGCIDL